MNMPRPICWVLLAIFLSACATQQPEPEPKWEPLFNGSDLTGWENVGNADWSVKDNCIVATRADGQTNKGWLVTEDEYSDFKLRLKFKTRVEEFNSGILFRDPGHSKVGRPAFNGFELQLLQEEGGKAVNPSGSIYDLARAFPRRIEPDTWIDVEIHCIGDHISAYIDGEKTAEAHTRRSFTGALGLQMHGGTNAVETWWKDIEVMKLPQASAMEKTLPERLENTPGEFVDFLAGKSIENDFESYWDGGASWSLKNGVLRGDSPAEISWLFTKESYGDYVLTFDYRLSKGGNAGVCLRFPWPENGDTSKGPASLGFECQIAETGEANPTGSIYNLARAYETNAWHRPIHRSGSWNHYRIYVAGDHIVAYINRHKTAEVHMKRSRTGRIGFQVHHPAKWAEYRNVQLKVIEEKLD